MSTEKRSMWARLKQKFSQTGAKWRQMTRLFEKPIDEEWFDALEEQLLTADVGLPVTEKILQHLRDTLSSKQHPTPESRLAVLQAYCQALLAPSTTAASFLEETSDTQVCLMVGVNGAGKTTTTGKLAQRFASNGKRVLLAAGDTFRAAAIDQLQVWGQRVGVDVVAQQPGACPAAVVFDAVQSAHAKSMDILIADTAGRLHTQSNLMSELSKIKRAAQKIDDRLPHEILLVLDGSMGQNALAQAKAFHEAIGVTGVIITKLDGTAKGGIVLAVSDALGVPIRFIGLGETEEDLVPFVPESFVEMLLGQTEALPA